MPTFQRFEDKTASAYYAPQATTELIRVNVPMGETFILSHFANEVNDARAWGGVLWQVYADGVPARNYDSIYDQLGTASQPREIPFGFITASRELLVFVTNTEAAGGNTYKVLASIKGAFVKND